VWIKTRTAAPSGLGKSQFSTFDDSADNWKDYCRWQSCASQRTCRSSHLRQERWHSRVPTPVVPLTRLLCSLRRPPERLSGYRAAQLQIQLCSMKGAPLALGDENVARLCQTIKQLAEIFRKAAGRHGEWPIDRLSQGVFEILGEAYIHENNWRACFTKCVCKLAGQPSRPGLPGEASVHVRLCLFADR